MITFVCPVCDLRWKVMAARREEERAVPCSLCEARGVTGTHWRYGAVDIGWYFDVPGVICVDYWLPFSMRRLPAAWNARVFGIGLVEAARRA